MKYAVDKVEEDIVLLENIINGEKKEIKKECFAFSVIETDIILFENGIYKKDYK